MKKLLTATLAVGLLMSAGGQASAATGSEIVNTGSKYLGAPYQYGAAVGNTRSFDCSSYTTLVFAQAGVSLPRTTAGQVTKGVPVSKSNLQVGDLVFFKTTSSYVGHVGIYVGNGKMMGSQSSTGVATVSINGPYWGERYVTARRVIDNAPAPVVKKTTPAPQAAPKAAPKAPAASIDGTVHTVVPGNTLWSLSQKYRTSVSSLKSANGLKSDTIYVGQKLKVGGAKATPKAAPAPKAAGSYAVKRGDTLWAISHKHGVSVGQLMKANQLTSSLIHPGQKLNIPQ